MKSVFRYLTLSAIFFMNSSSAFSAIAEGIFVNLGINYDTYDIEVVTENATTGAEETATSSTSTMIINFSGGYSLGNGFIAGIKYYNDIRGNSSESVNNTFDGENDKSAMGVMGGYTFDEFLFQFSYLAITAPEYTDTSDNGNDIEEYKDGGGMIFDFMYMFEAGGISFGPQISYIQFDYTKHIDNGTEDTLFVSADESWLKPMFAVAATF
ncbi:hypothetical protein N9W79_00750 [bacterium]|nr:hypothetical protein [bacterium]